MQFPIGSHNIRNATAAIAVSYLSGLKDISSLKTFKGVERRLIKYLVIMEQKFMMIMHIIQQK